MVIALETHQDGVEGQLSRLDKLKGSLKLSRCLSVREIMDDIP